MATYNIEKVITAPSDFSTNTGPLLDGSNTTGLTTVPSAAGNLTVGWNNPIVADGTGTITITTYGTISSPGYGVRLLLEDGSYSEKVVYSTGSAVLVNLGGGTIVRKKTLNLSDLYQGPLAFVGIEFSDFNYAFGISSWTPTLIQAEGVNVIPEPSVSLSALVGTGVLLGIRHRRASR